MTVLFIHGIGGTGAAWDDVITKLPEDIRVVTIDLLGFGKSPSPNWAMYDAKTQARSVLATYLKLRILGQVTVVGHSLGALVAIEVARRYPLLIKSLILCSPPIYDTDFLPRKLFFRRDHVLKKLYKSVKRRPDNFVKLSAIAMKYNLINRSYNVTEDNIDSYMTTLESMIINQTSLRDASNLQTSIHIIKGTLDPFIVSRNLKKLKKLNPKVHISTVVASHEVRGPFISAVVKAIKKQAEV